MGNISKITEALANVQRQRKSKKTRWRDPRYLTEQEVNALIAKRDALRAQLKEARQPRILHRINKHTTAESAETRAHVTKEAEVTREQLQPLTSLVTINAESAPKERIKAR